MATDFDRRLDRVAAIMRVCPRHADPLRCVICDLEETPLPAEQEQELRAFLERLTPHLTPLPVAGRCPWCKAPQVCLACCDEVSGPERDWGPLSDAERERCIDLLDRTDLRLKRDRRSVNTYG
jgi:hypothetical protein